MLKSFAVVTRDDIFIFGEYKVDPKERRIWRRDSVISLSPKTFDLLVVMLQDAGRLLEKEYLIHSVWPDSYVQDANLSVHIASLRKVLGTESKVRLFIETVPKVGYRFVVPVSRLLDSEPAVAAPIALSASSLPPEEASRPSPPASIDLDQPRSTLFSGGGRHRLRLMLLSGLVALSCIVLCFGGVRFLAGRKHGVAQAPPTTKPLISTPGLFLQPAFSPDGRELAYTWRSRKDTHQSIYLQQVESDDRRILIDTGLDDYSPAWSHRGTEIAFLHSLGDDKPLEIVIVNKLNSKLRTTVTTICGANDAFRNTPTLSWSPDAQSLVTTDCSGPKDSPSLFLVSVDTGQKRQLTHAPPQTIDDQAAFSPDGNLVAFRRSQGDSSDEIYVVKASGGHERKLTSLANPVDGLAWSADGTRIVFSSGQATSLGNIWSLAVSGGEPIAVTTPLTHTSSPTVSPAGRTLAYVDSPNSVSVGRLTLDVHHEVEPFIASNFFDSSAVYSPDGLHVAFRSDRSGANEIWLCRSDGNEPKRITHFDGPMTGSPRWSPDGHSLAFDSRGAGRADVYIVRTENSEPLRITNSGTTNSDNVVPSWSLDGSAIYFSSNRTGQWQIWRHSLATGNEQQVTTRGGFDGMEGPDGKSLIYVGDMGGTQLRRMTLGRPQEDVPLASLGQGLWHSWTMSGNSLFYLKRSSNAVSVALMRLDLRIGRQQVLAQIEQAANDSISVSPDGKRVLFARRSNPDSSIMILEGWY